MKKYIVIISVFMIMGIVSCEKVLDLTSGQVVSALRETLGLGAQLGITETNKVDGYFGNSEIKIPFPQDAAFVETALRATGSLGDQLCDELILKLNRSAENAVGQVVPLLTNAIGTLNFTDAFGILYGAEDAATMYLKEKTFGTLKNQYKPEIENTLNATGATTAWTAVTTAYNNLPIPHDPVNTDLADYTTGKALDGLYVWIAKEEKKIRTDPASRTSELLRLVFGG